MNTMKNLFILPIVISLWGCHENSGDESNNSDSGPTLRPELTLYPTFNANAIAILENSNLSLQVGIVNNGEAISGVCHVKISYDPPIPTANPSVSLSEEQGFAVIVLYPGDSNVINLPFRTGNPGVQNYSITVDYANEVTESDESNNTLNITIPVYPAAPG